MKKIAYILLAALLVSGVVLAAQDSTLSQREVRDPLKLEAILEANASDAETRLAAIEGGSATVTQNANTLLVGNDSSNQVAMAVTSASDVSLSQDGTNVTITLDARTVAGEELEAVDPGYIFVGSASSNAEPVAVSGDATMGNDGAVAVVGLALTQGLDLPYANKTANYTNTATDVVISYDTSAATTNTLPEASTVLGKVFCIALQDDDGDLVVMTDGTDKFDGTNDILTFADAGDSCWLMATAADVYTILVNVGGALSD